MINVDTELDRLGVTRMVMESSVEPVQLSEVKVHRLTAEQSFQGVRDSEWGWRELRDYVVTQIEQRYGSFPRIEYKEQAIFKRFVKDWGNRAPAIARVAFEVEDGIWMKEPISLTRFSKGSDPYFAIPISERLAPDDLVTSW